MTIRPPTAEDWPRIGELSELIVRAHHGYDPSRFIPVEMLRADVYASRVGDELARGLGTVLVADIDGHVAGYAFAGIEPRSWKELRHEAGYVHDLVVGDAHRHAGVGAALVASAVEWLDARGITRIML